MEVSLYAQNEVAVGLIDSNRSRTFETCQPEWVSYIIPYFMFSVYFVLIWKYMLVCMQVAIWWVCFPECIIKAILYWKGSYIIGPLILSAVRIPEVSTSRRFVFVLNLWQFQFVPYSKSLSSVEWLSESLFNVRFNSFVFSASYPHLAIKHCDDVGPY